MRLGEEEHILRIYYHHYYPFVLRLIKVVIATIPFYFIVFILSDSLKFSQILLLNLIIVIIFSLVTIYVTLIYWLDRLIVTNKRIVYIDWKYLTVKSEYETEIQEIQDMVTQEKGIIAILPMFDYGTIEIKSASAQTTILFDEAPDPHGIKSFIQVLLLKQQSYDRGPRHFHGHQRTQFQE